MAVAKENKKWKPKILILETSSEVRYTVGLVLGERYEVLGSGGLAEGLGLVEKEGVELVILGVEYPFSYYLPILQSLRRRGSRLPVLFLISQKTDQGIEFPNSDWLMKPFYPEELEAKVESLLLRGKRGGKEISSSVFHPLEEKVRGWIYSSRIPLEVREKVLRVCSLPLPVLIEGEEGTGKGWVARGVHYLGCWREREYLTFSCRGLRKTSFLEELGKRFRGREVVGGVDLYLEDVDLLSWEMQGYLKSQMEEGWGDCFLGFGGEVSVRVVGSARGSVLELMREGEFRRDLGERLLGLRIYLPPLRERGSEIGRIVEEVLGERGIGKRVSGEALEELSEYGWPGNVEELEVLVERTGVMVGGGEVLGGGWVWRFRGGGVRGGVFERGVLTGEEQKQGEIKGERRGAVEIGGGVKAGLEGEGVEVLLSTLVHEVKNPLVAISTFAHLLPERYEDGEFRVDFSRLVGLEVKRLNGVLEMLIDYGQAGTPCGKKVDLRRRVSALLGEMKREIEQKNIRIGMEGLENPPPIWFDERQVKFVLRRVLESVLGREVEKREAAIRGRIITKGIEEGGDWVELEVWYDGREGVVRDIPGMKDHGGRYDFESLSLGLGLARRLMMRNGGQMQVHQEEGIGTTILLRFRKAN